VGRKCEQEGLCVAAPISSAKRVANGMSTQRKNDASTCASRARRHDNVRTNRRRRRMRAALACVLQGARTCAQSARTCALQTSARAVQTLRPERSRVCSRRTCASRTDHVVARLALADDKHADQPDEGDSRIGERLTLDDEQHLRVARLQQVHTHNATESHALDV
jgi:hypothetical protein